MSCRHGWAGPLFVLTASMSLVNARAGDGEAPEVRATAPRATAFEPLPLGSIKPAGWLKDQLRIQADGLSGHLDEFWPDIKDSAWFGGKAEGWERVPYWLDGLVPLAYLLDDPALKAKVKKSDRLHPRSPAARRLARARRRQPEAQALRRLAACSRCFKALTQYQEATGDPRVVPATPEMLPQDRPGDLPRAVV